MTRTYSQIIDYKQDEWQKFPGGELEGKRPRRLCAACRAAVHQGVAHGATVSGRRTLCFECYRAEIDCERALKAAGELDTASEARFQTSLPFEPVHRQRLEMLKAARAAGRRDDQQGLGRFEVTRRQAQLAARHALQRIAAGLAAHHASRATHIREMGAAIHAAELQLPESWLPFVVSQ